MLFRSRLQRFKLFTVYIHTPIFLSNTKHYHTCQSESHQRTRISRATTLHSLPCHTYPTCTTNNRYHTIQLRLNTPCKRYTISHEEKLTFTCDVTHSPSHSRPKHPLSLPSHTTTTSSCAQQTASASRGKAKAQRHIDEPCHSLSAP